MAKEHSSNDRRKAQATPQGSHKEKARENLQTEEGQGFMQGARSKENKQGTQKRRIPHDFDRNEGEQESQKS